jgi:mannose-binding lectin 1
MRSLASLSFLVAAATAQSVIESSSFGYGHTYVPLPLRIYHIFSNGFLSISPDRDSIPGWQVGGEGHTPQIVRSFMPFV